jgi:class 3 adenylate cyclase/tetratricopeptide (TPR) repeat protein
MSGHETGTRALNVPAQASAGPPSSAEEIASVDRAIAALEAQRGILGDDVVDTALDPLRARRAELEAPRAEQRRLVTVVFADLVDFTVLSRQLDAEDTREVVGAYFARWQRAIEDQGGVVEKFIGDAVMAVFGLSRSFEDDAHRAVRSALAMLGELDDLNADLGPRFGVTLHMRVGIDTGEVVVSTLGERAGHGFVAVGPTVNRASRLQAAAPVDRVLISGDTQRQVRGAFGIESRQGMQLKGIDEPVDAFVVTHERRLGFTLDPSGGVEGVETSTVGRDLQLRFLQDRLWDVVDESRWRIVTVIGDAGVGKSRLLFDFDAWLAERPETFWWFRGRAAPSGQHGVNVLLRDVLTSRLDIQIDDATEVVLSRLTTGFVSALGPETGPRQAALVGAWLGFDVADSGFDLPSEPQALRDQGTEILGEYFRTLSEQAPVLMMLEDLHWADEGTLRWLDAVAPALADARVIVVATTRPSFLESHPRWGEGLNHHARLPLSPLSRRESRSLVQQILRYVEHLPAELVELVIDSAEGNPFYVEELVTWLIDAGVVVRGEPHWVVVHELIRTVAVPSTLKGVLQSRLDALSLDERNLLQRASVVGRVFWDLAVAALDDDAPVNAEAGVSLDNLRRRELLLQREVSHFASAREFLFKHALLRDVAYDGVLRAHRERYHRRAANWLVEISTAAGREDEYAAVIAEHYERARDPLAATWYLRAGARAASVFALQEATRMLDKAIQLVSDEDLHLRFDILLEREALFDRAGERDLQHQAIAEMPAIAERLDPPRRVRLHLAQSRMHFMHSEYEEALVEARGAVELAAEVGHEALHAESVLAEGKALTWSGDGAGAEETLTRAVELARPIGRPALLGEGLRYLAMLAGNSGDFPTSLQYAEQAREVFARAGDTELESMALAQQATTLFLLGRYAEAQDALEATLPIFRRSGHRYREAVNLGNLAAIAMMRGHLASADRYAQQALDASRQVEDVEAAATYQLVLGVVATETSRIDDGRAHLESALEIAESLGVDSLRTDALSRLTVTELAAGNLEAALSRARDGAVVAETVASDLDKGYAQLALGYAAKASGLWDEAGAGFESSLGRFVGLELEALVRESTVGLAGVAAARGLAASGVEILEPVLEHLDAEGLSGTYVTGEMLLICDQVLKAAADPRRDAVREAARAYLRSMAEEVGDPDLAAGFVAYGPHARLLADD